MLGFALAGNTVYVGAIKYACADDSQWLAYVIISGYRFQSPSHLEGSSCSGMITM